MTRKKDTPATREALLAAAAELFAEYGFEGATVDRIARQAKVNKAAISYHFQGKRRLYLALIGDSFEQLGRRIDQIRGAGGTPEDRLFAFATAFQEFARRRPAFPRLMLREALNGGRNLDAKLFPHFLRVFELLRETLEEGASLGRFRQVNPLCMQLSLVGSLLFFHSTEKFRSRLLKSLDHPAGAVTEEEFTQFWKESILRSLASEPSDGSVSPRSLPAGEPETRSET